MSNNITSEHNGASKATISPHMRAPHINTMYIILLTAQRHLIYLWHVLVVIKQVYPSVCLYIFVVYHVHFRNIWDNKYEALFMRTKYAFVYEFCFNKQT